MVATTSQETIGNILISASLVSFLFSTFLATVVFDEPSACTDAYIPEIEMSMLADPGEQHIDVWIDAFLPMHSIVDIRNVKRVDRNTGKTKPGGLIDLFPSNGPAMGRGTFFFKLEIVDRSKIPYLANITAKMVPAAYIKKSTFTSFKKGYLKMMALYIKYFKYLVAMIVLMGLSLIGMGILIVWRSSLNKKKTTPVHAKVEITGDTYEDGRNGHSMIKTPTHDYPTPIHTFQLPKSYTAANQNGLLTVSSFVPGHQTTPVHAFETPVHMISNTGNVNNAETPVVAFMETPSDNATVDVIVEPIPVGNENDAEEILAGAENGAENEIPVEEQVEEVVTASVETLVHDLVDKIAPAATDTSVRASVKSMVHSMVEKLVHTLVESLNANAIVPVETEVPEPEPEPEPEPVVESPIESLDEALRDTPEVETESDIQLIEVAPAQENSTNPEEEKTE